MVDPPVWLGYSLYGDVFVGGVQILSHSNTFTLTQLVSFGKWLARFGIQTIRIQKGSAGNSTEGSWVNKRCRVGMVDTIQLVNEQANWTNEVLCHRVGFGCKNDDKTLEKLGIIGILEQTTNRQVSFY